MKNIIKLEELALFGTSIWLFSQLPYEWWWFPLLILTPDVSILGYLLGSKNGAAIYNFFHHRGLALLLFFAGIYFQNKALELCGIILFGHSSMDRILGYGLKYKKGFKFTHLGEIGR